MSFSNYLRKKLIETNTTQAQLAKDIHTTNATINRWLKPFSINPCEKSIEKVIEYFGDDYEELTRIFYMEKRWGKYFWKNFRSLVRDRRILFYDIPDVDKNALGRYWDGECEYVELDDIKKIASCLNCPIDLLVDSGTMQDGSYNNVDIIGSGDRGYYWGLATKFVGDYLVLTTEMEPIIHYGDQIMVKRDYIDVYKKLNIPQRGDIVVLRQKIERPKSEIPCLNSVRPCLIRRFDIVNGKGIYLASNAQYPPIPASEDYEVEGIVANAITLFL
ncbi:MAG: hypothetical protein IKO03_05770 [Lachnospiraceae bacterium]|nr:hypothetical protein [Lachnospiraceae bacterium]